jgi:hypothetical protein
MRQNLNSGAGDESRTRDLNLGKVALYQLSYSRILLPTPSIYCLLQLTDAYLQPSPPHLLVCCIAVQRRSEIMYKPLKRVKP